MFFQFPPPSRPEPEPLPSVQWRGHDTGRQRPQRARGRGLRLFVVRTVCVVTSSVPFTPDEMEIHPPPDRIAWVRRLIGAGASLPMAPMHRLTHKTKALPLRRAFV